MNVTGARFLRGRPWEVVKYLATSASVYVFIVASLYALVDLLSLGTTPAYVITYLMAYVMEYAMTLRFVFGAAHSGWKVAKYVLYLAASLAVSTLLYRFVVALGVNYVLAALLVAAALMPVRFVVNKMWVYR